VRCGEAEEEWPQMTQIGAQICADQKKRICFICVNLRFLRDLRLLWVLWRGGGLAGAAFTQFLTGFPAGF